MSLVLVTRSARASEYREVNLLHLATSLHLLNLLLVSAEPVRRLMVDPPFLCAAASPSATPAGECSRVLSLRTAHHLPTALIMS